MKKLDLVITLLIILIVALGGLLVYYLMNGNNATNENKNPDDASVSDIIKEDVTSTPTIAPASLDQFNTDYYEDLGVPAPTDTTNLGGD